MDRYLYYLLADGIYPDRPLFAKPIHHPYTPAERLYLKEHEAARKVVERCFGVLQARFHILRKDKCRWDLEEVVSVSEFCVALHNIIITMNKNGDFSEETNGRHEVMVEILWEGDGSDDADNDNVMEQGEEGQAVVVSGIVDDLLVREVQFTSQPAFASLRADLIENLEVDVEE